LDNVFRARFINRAFHRMWALPVLRDGASYDFADIVEHGRQTGAYISAPGSVDDYVRQRKGRLRLSDGRILKFECRALPDGGRMMTFADISDLVRIADQLRELSAVDDLTRLPNRRQFLKSLENEFARAQRNDRPLSVLMIDADDFKLINDRHGHFAGDEVLRAVADRLRGIVRQTDLLGRLGGEEFGVALTETDMPSALETAERLCREIEAEPFQIAGNRIQVTVSVGVGNATSDGRQCRRIVAPRGQGYVFGEVRRPQPRFGQPRRIEGTTHLGGPSLGVVGVSTEGKKLIRHRPSTGVLTENSIRTGVNSERR
jgi:diguanylate cyclase (GGDEF)-like protein